MDLHNHEIEFLLNVNLLFLLRLLLLIHKIDLILLCLHRELYIYCLDLEKKLSGFEDFDDDIEGYFGEKIEDFESWEFERCFFEMLEMILLLLFIFFFCY